MFKKHTPATLKGFYVHFTTPRNKGVVVNLSYDMIEYWTFVIPVHKI